MNQSRSAVGAPQTATATPTVTDSLGTSQRRRIRPWGEQLTVGVEEEFLLVDSAGRLSPRATEVLDSAKLGHLVQHEVTKFQVEACTSVCHTMEEVSTQLRSLRTRLAEVARDRGLRLVATGTPVLDRVAPPPLTDDDRYHRMAEHYGALLDGHTICGCHVHIGMPDTEHAVHVSNHLRQWLPALLALSANSPFFDGRDTGHASWRSLIWSRWPSAGPPPLFDSAAHYESTVRALLASTAALDRGMVYWDIRVSSHLPTLELRVCDTAATVQDAVLIAALTRGLAVTALADLRRGELAPRISHTMLRTALWRAAKDGLEGDCVDPLTGRMVPALSLAHHLIRRIRPALEAAGDLPLVTELLREVRTCGSGSARQRRAFARRRQLTDVIDLLATQTASPLLVKLSPSSYRRQVIDVGDGRRMIRTAVRRLAPGHR